MRSMCSRLNRLSIIDLGHSSDTSAPQSRILVTVAPAIDCSLNETSLSTQARVQLCKSPTDSVAFSLVNQSIAAVLVFAAASSGVDTVLSLELWAQGINIDRFYVASDGIFHLDAVARIFKGDPLHTIVILSHDKWCGCWNGTWCRVRVDSTVSARNVVLIHWRPILRMLLLRSTERRSWSRDLWDMWLHLGSWATSHTLLRMLTWMLLHLVLTRRMRHEQIWLRSHRLMMLLLLMCLGRVCRGSLRWHRWVLLLGARIVHLGILL